MQFTVKERLQIVELLPKSGGKIETIVVKELVDKLSLSLEEINLIGFKQDGGMLRWDPTKEQPKEINLTAAEIDILKTIAKNADEQKTYTLQTIDTLLKLESLAVEEKPKEDAQQ